MWSQTALLVMRVSATPHVHYALLYGLLLKHKARHGCVLLCTVSHIKQECTTVTPVNTSLLHETRLQSLLSIVLIITHLHSVRNMLQNKSIYSVLCVLQKSPVATRSDSLLLLHQSSLSHLLHVVRSTIPLLHAQHLLEDPSAAPPRLLGTHAAYSTSHTRTLPVLHAPLLPSVSQATSPEDTASRLPRRAS